MGLRYLPEDPESDQTDPTQSALDCLLRTRFFDKWAWLFRACSNVECLEVIDV